MKIKRNILTRTLLLIYKYWPFIFLIASIITSLILWKCIDFDFKKIKKLAYIDIIITLLPLVFTIITLSLSLPSEKIYGTTFSTIRKIRKDKHFKFSEMLGINIVIFILLTVFLAMKFVIEIWALDIISVIYCCLFLKQELPLIIKDNKKIKLMIKKSGYFDKNFDFFDYDGLTSEGSEVLGIMKNIVLIDGIVSAYNSFKTKNKIINSALIDNLLSLQNAYLQKCVENIDFLLSISSMEYDGIQLLAAVEMSFRNILDCIEFNKDFNYFEIAGEVNSLYQITQSLHYLKKLTNAMKLDLKFNTLLRDFLIVIGTKLRMNNATKKQKNFLYEILNTLIIQTISRNEFWFLMSLRDTYFESRFSYDDELSYFFFVCIYIYYLCEIDKTVHKELKEQLKQFILEQCKGSNSDKDDNIISIFNFFQEYCNFKEMAYLIVDLIDIFKSRGKNNIWYRPPYVNSWSSENGSFDMTLVFNCWLITLCSLCNYQNFDFEYLKNIFNQLERDNIKIYECVSEDWIENGNFVISKRATSFLNFYKSKNHVYINLINKDFCTNFARYLNENKKKEIIESIKENNISDEQFKKIKSSIIKQFNDAAHKMSEYNNNVCIGNAVYKYVPILNLYNFDSKLPALGSTIKRLFKKIIYDDLKVMKNIQLEINETNKDVIIKKVLSKKYNYRNGGLFLLYNLNVNNDYIEEISKIAVCSDLVTPNLTLWENGAIKFNVDCDENETEVRKLTRDEINRIIDCKYSQVDGLYKYSDSIINYKSIFISRDELFKIISERYYYIVIVFRYSLIVDDDKIVTIYEKKHL